MSRFTYEISQDIYADEPDKDTEILSELVLDVPRYVDVNTAGVDVNSLRSADDPAEYLRTAHGAVVVIPVYAYCHSGVTIRAGESGNPFTCPWDSGIAGFAWTTADRLDYFGVSLQDAATAVRQDVDMFDQWLTGDVYVVTVTDLETGETVESVCGVYGMEWAESEGRSMVQACEDSAARERARIDARELVAARSWWQD